ncbi:hypothetical protein AB0M02_45065 [Actinoplanes sp. NPDC051861]|uniref:hypothetical protein n=1 Tax=Actinoplanes sp. NPDC051861 TaxID=3155170 RepID=UPI003426969B
MTEPIRRHLIALPRGRPGARRHLVAIPRRRPGGGDPTIAILIEPADTAARRDRRPVGAVVASLCVLALICCGAPAALYGWNRESGNRAANPVPARVKAVPSTTPSEKASTAAAPLPAAQRDVRVGARCAPAWALGRTATGLLVVCGIDRRGRERWRPLTPAAYQRLTGRTAEPAGRPPDT